MTGIDTKLDEILKAVFADGIYYDGNEIECDDTPMSIDEAKSALKKLIQENIDKAANCKHLRRISVDTLPPEIGCIECGANLKEGKEK